MLASFLGSAARITLSRLMIAPRICRVTVRGLGATEAFAARWSACLAASSIPTAVGAKFAA